MRTEQIVKAQARISALLAAKKAGVKGAAARRDKLVGRTLPDRPHMATDLFRPLWEEAGLDLDAPRDTLPDTVHAST
ncbi:MAG TPA: hypothetical protein PLW81_11620 [Thiobacillaceae bacterium]|nr:hypothetical protein [Thiobacillaceae bacterium]